MGRGEKLTKQKMHGTPASEVPVPPSLGSKESMRFTFLLGSLDSVIKVLIIRL